MKGIDIESIYTNLKMTSEKMKEKIILKNKNIFKSESKNKKEQIKYLKTIFIFPTLNTNYTYKKFSTYTNQFLTECPLITEMKENFQNFSNQNTRIEITNKIYDLNHRINYYKLNNKIKIQLELEGDSKFWLFLHCEEKFNDKTAVVLLSKENYDRNFISFGIFLNKNETSNITNSFDGNINININSNENKDYEFIELKKQELVEENTIKEREEKLKKNKEQNNDEIIEENNYQMKSLYDLYVVDDGIKILCNVKLNGGGGTNDTVGDFFYPVFENIYEENNDEENEFDNIIKLNMNEKDKKNKDNNSTNLGYKIKIAGSGDKCTIISFINEFNLKNQKYEYNNKQADCQCCFIF